jgi:hypothetical protein
MSNPVITKPVSPYFENLSSIVTFLIINMENSEKNRYGMSEFMRSFKDRKKGLNAKNATKSKFNILSNFPKNMLKITTSDSSKKKIPRIFIANKFKPEMA